MALGPGIDSEPSEPSPSDYRVGVIDLISRTLSLYARGFVQYLVIVGIVSAALAVFPLAVLWVFFNAEALILVGYVGTSPSSFISGMSSLALLLSNPIPGFEIDITADPLVLLGVGLVISMVGVVIMSFISGASIKYAHEEYGGQSINIGEAFSYVRMKFGPILVTTLIFELLIIIIGIPGILLLLVSLSIGNLSLLMGGSIALLAGMIITLFLQIRLYPAIAVVIAEDKSSVDALKRAFELTSGEFWHVFGGQILLSIITLVITSFLPFLFDLFVSQYVSDLIVSIISALLFNALSFIYQAVLYRDLEARKAVTMQEWW